MMTDLSPLLSQPDVSIAVIGATDHGGKYGGIIYRDLKRKGYRVFGVNPYRETVDGDSCWKTVLDLPEKPTIADFVIPARRGLDVLDECEQAGIRNIWLQPGAESAQLIERLESGPFDWLAHACIMVRASMAPRPRT
jgi:predicted CoA-binding protein